MADIPAQKRQSACAAINFDYTPIYPPQLTVEDGKIAISCDLPEDACVGDIILLSATAIDARNSNFTTQLTLTEHHLTLRKFNDSLSGKGRDGDYVLQLNLYGKHTAIKNSNSFSVAITNAHVESSSVLTSPLGSNWIERVKQGAKQSFIALLSAF
ncbi:hypothetical protein [Pseudoalteromonas xiamenensis]|uniref:Uncharacterized protein n=1 Tax=Pseudoalteromonas xiamenensis TaxID=882626 RepID=A0A975DN83_9GAMM|nr:hypothetical protein [Pseudoalteromonas xiamenensis]QTH73506.1 hypothetical protein J5O05_18620 [Pseudoalteromonas xiamenensis]